MEGGRRIAEAMSCNRSLRVLDIGYSKISVDGIIQVFTQ
jgi:hypothetical protein